MTMKKRLSLLLAATFIGQSLYAGCEKELFTINSERGLTIHEVIDQLSAQCQFSLVLKDEEAKAKLDDEIERLSINNATLPEILTLLLTDNGFDYTLKNNILKVSYLSTKTFKVDYVGTDRAGESNTDITLSGNTGIGAGVTGAAATTTTGPNATMRAMSGTTSTTGSKTKSTDKFEFWSKLDKDLLTIINSPEDSYKAPTPIINKEAGLVTVTGTRQQLKRVEEYLEHNVNRLHKQVLIDVQILNVTLNGSSQTGVDWSQLFKLQNFKIGYNHLDAKNVETFSDGLITTAATGDKVQRWFPTNPYDLSQGGSYMDVAGERAAITSAASLLNISNSISINNLIMFLKTQGDVTSMSNPKVMTLDNQPALISSGDQIYYRRKDSTSTTSTTTTTASNEIIESVFAGVLLDITPQISDDDRIVLKINPSISSCKETGCGSASESGTGVRLMPPDLQKKQLSSVIKVKDGDRIILGGLISTSDGMTETKLPLLGDIPGLGYLFKQNTKTKQVSELVIIITPYIVKNDKKPSLKDLGFSDSTQTQSQR